MASLAVAPAAANIGAPNIKDFANNLARYPTTSEALTEWCGKEKIVREPIIRVQILPEGVMPPIAIHRLLEARPDVRLGYRHVHIACQNTVLVDGHNWFVPSLLTPEMMRLISETDTPFDIATKELRYQREVLVTVPGANEGCPALTIYTRRSLLRLPDGRPLALHLECFTGANLKR